MSSEMASEDTCDQEVPVKTHKINHIEDVPSPDDFPATKNGEDMAEKTAGVEIEARTRNDHDDGAEPREFQAMKKSNMAGGGDGPRGNNSAESSPSSGIDLNSSDTEQDYQLGLPVLKMPEVFDFSNLSYKDRLDGLFDILPDRKPFEVQQAFACHVEDESAALRDCQAVWRSIDLACDILVEMKDVNCDDFPIMMEVELVEPFFCLPGSTCSSVTQEQVSSYLKNHENKVDIVEVCPVYDDSGDLDAVALAIEHTRFFFEYIWRLSDDNDTGDYSFALRHLEPRLKLYFDVINKKVSTGLAMRYRDIMAEYHTKLRQFRQKQALLESDEDDDYDSDYSDYDTYSDKDSENEETDKENNCDKDDDGDMDKDIDMDYTNMDGDTYSDKNIKDKNGDKDKNSEDQGDTDGDNDMDMEERDSGKDISKGKVCDDSDIEKEDKDSDTKMKIRDEFEVVEMARLWKDITLLQNTLEIMENPVMRYLTDLPSAGRKRKLSNSAVEIRQLRHHNEPVTHIVAEKMTAGMIQDLQLPSDTVIETHTTPASALASCYDNDTVLITPGIYSGEGLNMIHESVTIQGIGNPENVVIVFKFREGYDCDRSFVGCCAQNLAIQNLTFVDESTEEDDLSCSEIGGILEVALGRTSLTNCRFKCRSSGLVVRNHILDMDNCEVYGAQAPGLTLWHGSKLRMESCRIHGCGKKAPASAEMMCGVHIKSTQSLENRSSKSNSSVTIQGCKIQGNSGPGILLKIFSLEKQQEAKTTDLDGLCTLTHHDLQVTDSDLSGNGKGVAMVAYELITEGY